MSTTKMNLEEHANGSWTAVDGKPNIDQLKFGALQRIATSLDSIQKHVGRMSDIHVQTRSELFTANKKITKLQAKLREKTAYVRHLESDRSGAIS